MIAKHFVKHEPDSTLKEMTDIPLCIYHTRSIYFHLNLGQ